MSNCWLNRKKEKAKLKQGDIWGRGKRWNDEEKSNITSYNSAWLLHIQKKSPKVFLHY